ncbi:Lrp/AsnC family transcriptional regulator [Altererythrobacter sp. Root672]|uniref:Lrp/AsnC family transcriptional regulator n=1 Tax=Altererythrobacter sp. Root672 TaxID=1736584 RepID=UPI0006FBF417|nr:Lrp/AsnC family transcriptional regulator [Altererythrobacter sp. Root672]KRA84210.1 AsnC family transcriptional regulator [Altererythrobacter sp. Root672]
MQSLDRTDRKILKVLAENARAPVSQIAQQVNLSQPACSRRLHMLEEGGVITRYEAELDLQRLGFRITALVDIQLRSQSEGDMAAFEAAVADHPQIVECMLVSGEQDYRLKVIARDLEDYEQIHRTGLARLPGVMRIASSFALRIVSRRHPVDAVVDAA